MDYQLPELTNKLYEDKACCRPDVKDVRDARNMTVFTSVKKKGQKYLDTQMGKIGTHFYHPYVCGSVQIHP